MTDPMTGQQLPEGAEVRSAIVWFRGYPEGSEHYARAAADGGFVHRDYVPAGMPLHVWPAALQTLRYNAGGRLTESHEVGVRVGVDVQRGCWVVDVPGVSGVESRRVLLNLRAGIAAVHIARAAAGDSP